MLMLTWRRMPLLSAEQAGDLGFLCLQGCRGVQGGGEYDLAVAAGGGEHVGDVPEHRAVVPDRRPARGGQLDDAEAVAGAAADIDGGEHLGELGRWEQVSRE